MAMKRTRRELKDVSEEELLSSPMGVWFPSAAPNEDLSEACREALVALRREDLFLRTAFERRTDWRASLHKGLTYKVFETTLVYLMFRAWVDHGRRAEWEVPYPKPNQSQIADLVLLPEGRSASPTVIEAKWWLGNDAETLESLRGDVERLNQWSSSTRVLLTFWWSAVGSWASAGPRGDRAKIREGLAEIGLEERPFFLGAFHTHVPHNKDWYFSMLALDASAAR